MHRTICVRGGELRANVTHGELIQTKALPGRWRSMIRLCGDPAGDLEAAGGAG